MQTPCFAQTRWGAARLAVRLVRATLRFDDSSLESRIASLVTDARDWQEA